jgi:hypothetical protein
MVTHGIRAFEYAIGDEVLIRLDDVAALDLAAGRTVAADRLPVWTIGDIVARVERVGHHLYAARFRLEDVVCIVVVDEHAIEGTV